MKFTSKLRAIACIYFAVCILVYATPTLSFAQCTTIDHCLEQSALVPSLGSTGGTSQKADDASLAGDLAVLVSFSKNRASIFRESAGTWTEEAALTLSFPQRVSTDGQRILIGGGSSSNFTGRATVFTKSGSDWVVQGTFNNATDIDFGKAVAIHGDLAVVGASTSDCQDGNNCGSAFIYRFNGSTWALDESLVAPIPDRLGRYGFSVAVRGNRIAVGEMGSGGPGGRVHIYYFNGSTWELETTLLSPSNGYQFGMDVALDDDLLLVGGNLGFIYRYDGTSWQPEATLAASSTLFLAIEDDIAVFGSPNLPCATGTECGGAHVFQRIAGVWTETGLFKASDTRTGDRLGGAVAVSGSKILLATTDCAIPSRLPCGRAFVFDLAESGPDCNCDGEADSCEVNRDGAPDCNANSVPDDCDLADGTLHDADENGIPDECAITVSESAAPDPTSISKQRFISFEPQNSGRIMAIRVRAVSLHQVDPPYTDGSATSFAAFEGQAAWVGHPGLFPEDFSTTEPFRAASLTCIPHYRNWDLALQCAGFNSSCETENDCPAGSVCEPSSLGNSTLHVSGSVIVPSSVYEVQTIGQGLDPSIELNYSPPITILTTRHGDLVNPFSPPSSTGQPDFGDISAIVNKFRAAPGAPITVRAKIASADSNGIINPQSLISFGDIAIEVDSFRGKPYPFKVAGHCTEEPNIPCVSNNDCTNSDAICNTVQLCPSP